MKNSVLALLATSIVALVGCSQGTPGGEGVVTNPPHKPPIYDESDNTFNLSAPRMTTTLHQGETKDVSIGIERGKNFDQDVVLKIMDGPKGVIVDSPNSVIKSGDKEVKLSFKAADDATLGDFTLKMAGHPLKGPDATIDFKIDVAKK